MSNIGDLIRNARQKKKLSQEGLAQAIGSTKSAISRYESGKRLPDYEQLQRIAATLDVEWLELVPEDKQGQIVIDHVIGKLRAVGKPRIDTGLVSAAIDGAVRAQHPELYEHEYELSQIDTALYLLNADGRQKAVERVEELTEIPRYRAETAPESTPTDTTPPPDAPETPPEGE